MGGIPQTPPPQLDLAKFCPEAARQNLAKSSRAFLEARNYLNYRGSIWAGQPPGKIWPNRATHFSSHTKGSPIWPNFARKLPGKISGLLAKNRAAHRVFWPWHYEKQPDLAKFCPQAARQNLAKSSRDSLNNFVQLVHSFPNGGDSPAPTPPPLEINEIIEIIELIELMELIELIEFQLIQLIQLIHLFPKGGGGIN